MPLPPSFDRWLSPEQAQNFGEISLTALKGLLDNDSDLFASYYVGAELFKNWEWPRRMVLVILLTAIFIFAITSFPKKPIFSRYPDTPSNHSSQALVGAAEPIAQSATPSGIIGQAVTAQEPDGTKVVNGLNPDEQFLVSADNTQDLALLSHPNGSSIRQLPNGIVVTMTGIVTSDNQWAYVRIPDGVEGWLQLKVLYRFTGDTL